MEDNTYKEQRRSYVSRTIDRVGMIMDEIECSTVLSPYSRAMIREELGKAFMVGYDTGRSDMLRFTMLPDSEV